MGNISRILPHGLSARLDKRSWSVPPIFELIQKTGNVNEEEMYQVFNMGIGMTIVCSPQQVAQVASVLPQAIAIGEIIETDGKERVILD